MSIWVVLNFLNKFSNAGTLQLLQSRMWESWNFEIQVLLNSLPDCLIVGVERFGLMTYFRVFLYCNCVFIRSIWSIMSLFNIETLVVFRWTCFEHWSRMECYQVALIYLMNRVLRSKNSHWSLENGTFFFHLEHQSRLAWYQVALIYHELDLELVGLVGRIFAGRATSPPGCSSNFSFWLSINFRTQFLLSNRDVVVDLSYETFPIFNPTTFGIQ